MPDLARHERLVEDLAGGLAPVRPLPGPAVRAALWLGAAALVGLVLASRIDAAGGGVTFERASHRISTQGVKEAGGGGSGSSKG